MKAILVNPENRTVTEIKLSDDPQLKEYYDIIDCELIDIAGIADLSIIVDDMGLFKNNGENLAAFVLTYKGEQTAPLVGKSIILGYDAKTGDDAPCPASLSDIVNGVRWCRLSAA